MQQSNPFVTFAFSSIPEATPLGSFLGSVLPEYQIERSPPKVSISALTDTDDLKNVIASLKESGCWRKLAEISKEHVKNLSLEPCTPSILGNLMIFMTTRLECLFRLQYYTAFQQELNHFKSAIDSINSKNLSISTEIRLLNALLPTFSSTNQNSSCSEQTIWLLWEILKETDLDVPLAIESIKWISSISVNRNSQYIAIMLLESLRKIPKYFNFAQLYTTLGELYLTINDFPTAASIWNEFAQFSDNDSQIQIHQSLLAMFNRDYQLAMNILGQLITKYPNRTEIHHQMAFIHFVQGEQRQALEQMENFISEYPLQASRNIPFISNLFHLYDCFSFPKDSKLAVIKALLPFVGDDFELFVK